MFTFAPQKLHSGSPSRALSLPAIAGHNHEAQPLQHLLSLTKFRPLTLEKAVKKTEEVALGGAHGCSRERLR